MGKKLSVDYQWIFTNRDSNWKTSTRSFDLETASPEQLSANAAAQDRTNLELQRVALRAHQEARQAQDLRADLARRTMPSDGPYFQGEKVFVWTQDSSKFKDKDVGFVPQYLDKKELWSKPILVRQ